MVLWPFQDYVTFFKNIIRQGPVVQSVVNELVKGHFVNCFSELNIQYSDIFCWKNVSTHIFSAKNFRIFAYHSVYILTNR